MKTLSLAFIIASCLSFCGCVTHHKTDTDTASDSCKFAARPDKPTDRYVQLLCITANVDGSGRIVFTSDSVHYEHKSWVPPTHVTFNGEPWNELDRTPSGWRDFSKGSDLTRARIVQRNGRDVIALERTAGGFDLYLCDLPNGSADYEVTIAIPRRN